MKNMTEAAEEFIPTKQRTKPRIPWDTLAVRKIRAHVKTTSQILTIFRILEDVRAKNLEATILFVGLWIHSQGKDGANATRLRPTKRKRRSHNDAL